MPTKFSEYFEGRLPKAGLPFTIGWELEYAHSNDVFSFESFPKGVEWPEWCSEHCGTESRSPVFDEPEKIDVYLKAFFEGLRLGEFETSTDCGGHLHIGLKGFPAKQLANALVVLNLCQNFFFDIVPPYRHANRFCRASTPAQLSEYLRAVRTATPLLLKGSREYSKVMKKFPENFVPLSREACEYSTPGWGGGYTWSLNLDSGLRESGIIAEACKPKYAGGLAILAPGNPAPRYSIPEFWYGWFRLNLGHSTLEFRLLPTTTDEQEWTSYLAFVSWFMYKLRKDAKGCLEEILSHSDEAIINGELPFKDWPKSLLNWRAKKKAEYKYPKEQYVPSTIQPATAAA